MQSVGGSTGFRDRKSESGGTKGERSVRKQVLLFLWMVLLSLFLSGCLGTEEDPGEDNGGNGEASEGLNEDEYEDTPENPVAVPQDEPEQVGEPVEIPPRSESSELQNPSESVEVTPVQDSFPESVDALNESTLTSEEVIRYFEDRYGNYGGSFVIQVTVRPNTYKQEGTLYHEKEALYTLTRKEDDAILGKEVYRQVYRQVPVNPRIMDSLDGEYNRVVESEGVLQETEERVVGQLNDARVENGLSALSTASDLTRLARIKSSDMGLYDYFAHRSPTYGSPFEMGSLLGVQVRGENIQWATWNLTADEIHRNFMNSEGHRKNRMTEGFTEVGIGIIQLENGYYVTELFR